MNGRFRVWDGEEMHEPPHEYIYDPREGARRVIDASDGRITCSQSIDGEVLWGTGLTDAEGAEVYKGDIVEHWSHDHSVRAGGPPKGHSRIGAVKYIDAHWWIDFTDPGKMFLSDISHKDSTTQIIGNRYEDPILLEEPTS